MARKIQASDTANLFFDNHVNLNTRTLYIGSGEDGLDEESVGIYIKGLHLLNSASADSPITIILNNPGGDVIQGFALIDFIKQLSNSVHVYVYGQCYSMAVALLQTGDERYISEHSSVLIHDGFSAVEGYNKNTLKNWAKFTDQLDRWYEDLLLARIQEKHEAFTKKKLQSMTAHDTILTAKEAVALGLADAIIGE